MKRFLKSQQGRAVTADGRAIDSTRWYVVKVTPAVTNLIAQGKLVGNAMAVPDEATDDLFKGFFDDCDGDDNLAIDSFISSFEPEVEVAPVVKAKPPVAARK
jgi:hypothetical protein